MRTGLKKPRRPPFVVAYKAVLRNAKLSPQSRLTLMVLKSYANSDSTHCFPSIDKLAKDVGCSRSSLKRYLDELQKAGLIYREQRKTAANVHSSCTYLLYDDIKARSVYKPRSIREPRTGSPVSHGERENIVPFTEEMRDFA